MTTIVTRAGKGSPLTNAEIDQNFLNLNSAKLEAGDLSPYLLSATAASTYQTIAGMSSYQSLLVSGTNIKTVNGTSVLGSGNIQIDGGVTSFNTRTGAVTLSSGDVAGALGFTPYSDANPSGYITSSALSPYLLSATAASTYQTLSGMSSYLTSASASSTYFPLAGGSVAGSLDFSGTGRRITGDFTNGTIASRVLVQTSTANSNTVFGVIPNGTSVNAQLHVWGNSDPTNAPLGALIVNSTSVRLQSAASGTGTILPLQFWQGTSEAARFDAATSNFLIGTSTDSGNGDKLQVNGSARFSGQVGGGPFRVYGASGNVFNSLQSGSTGSYANFQNGTGAMQIGRDDGSGAQWGIANANVVWATGAYPLVLGVNTGEAMRFAPTTRNLLVGTTTDDTTSKLQVAGVIRSTTGGFKFPDGTTQTTAASGVSTSAANTWTATQTFNGSSSTFGAVLTDTAETVNVVAAAPSATTNLYVQSGSVQYYTSNAANNFVVNLAFSSGTSMNTALATGQSVTAALVTTQGSTAYYATSIQVDGTTSGVTTKWIGGAPTAGNASGLDTYRFSVIKTASATYTVLASLTQFK
jgi:hypothetical protein